MTNLYATAYTEVLEILKYLPKEEYHKIPKEKIEYYQLKCDKSYQFKLEADLKNISKEANCVLVSLFRDYFTTPQQKEKLRNILENNQRKEEELKREKYSPDNLFSNNNVKEIDNEAFENVQVIEYKEQNTFQKLLSNLFIMLKKVIKF